MTKPAAKKKAVQTAQLSQFIFQNKTLLDFAFFVFHVLARHRIVLFDDHLLGHGPRVFLCNVEMACPRLGVQTNLDLGWLGHNLSPEAARLSRGAA